MDTKNYLFYIKKTKLLRDGTAPIYLRITIDGQRAEIGIKKSVLPSNWYPLKQQAIGKDAKSINSEIETHKLSLDNYRRQLIEKNEPITADALKARITGENLPHEFLLEYFQKHNDMVKSLIGIEFALATHKRYVTVRNHVREFLKLALHKKDIPLISVNLDFLNRFKQFLRRDKKCGNNTTFKYMKFLKKIINQARNEELIRKDPYTKFKMTLEKIEIRFLSDEELEILATKIFETDRLEIVKDIFLFGCYTGLAYIDIKNLLKKHIQYGYNNSEMIILPRQKSGIISRIPLLPAAKRIIEKYKNHEKCLLTGKLLPIPSNQKMNGYLKEIGAQCGINKPLTTHIARHTFATTVALSNGVPIETVSKMLGHTNILTTQHYAKVVGRKMYEDTLSLMERYD